MQNQQTPWQNEDFPKPMIRPSYS